MNIIYSDSSTINYKLAISFINNISNFKKIGRGTYCECYKISDEYVIKYYSSENNYDKSNNDFIEELKTEINFIKEFNYLPMIADTYFIISVKNSIFIIQEYIKIQNIVNITYNTFFKNLDFYIKVLKASIELSNIDIINIDIKYNNMGYDKYNNLKFFDFNLIQKITNYNNKLNFYDKYDYYYLHPVKPVYPQQIIPYSLAIIILESFSTYSECKKFLYKPDYLNKSKYQLLKIKKNLLTQKLFEIILSCFNFQYTSYDLYEKMISLYGKKNEFTNQQFLQ